MPREVADMKHPAVWAMGGAAVLVAAVLVAVVAVFVWPGRYQYLMDRVPPARINRVTGSVEALIDGAWVCIEACGPPRAAPTTPEPPQHTYAVLTSWGSDGSIPDIEMITASDPDEAKHMGEAIRAVVPSVTVWKVFEVDPVATYTIKVDADLQRIEPPRTITIRARDEAQAWEVARMLHRPILEVTRVALGD
jgi:hypothetical protein